MKGDRYYGKTAREYEATRANKQMWKDEHAAVKSMLRKGPVIDVPCGTGRFFPIYKNADLNFVGADISTDMLAEAQRKHPDAKLERADLLTMPHTRRYRTAVCVRLLHWLEHARMRRACRQLRGIADEVIVNIGLGLKGEARHATIDHDEIIFLSLFEGMMHRRVFLQENKGRNRWFMFHFWRPEWADVEWQFVDREPGTMQLLADIWCERFGIKAPRLGDQSITCEYWTPGKVWRVVQAQLPHEPAMVTDKKPRLTDQPLTVLRTTAGDLMIDGRRRANALVGQKTLQQVLVIQADRR